ncbi:sorting nexin-2 [Eurytemora carolleeae]|uniref:sorting nexin-2 n=1 Tax=Eurytemora carolleeae TaxID=1294199 RepID=UPI000C75A52A|nr:sorting nexin-2 [Eurytemora carolleeae]|eukprot:XP_023321177.1 sorting nexin-2-like [Eurytemora affinis]
MKIFNCDLSPDEDDLFSDCRSQHSGSQVGLGSVLEPEPGVEPSSTKSCQHIQSNYPTSSSPTGLTSWTIGADSTISIRTDGQNLEEFISVIVSDPHKVGDGISSYMVYRVAIRTNLKCFRRGSWSVVRRYSDFLGLHDKLVGKYQARGRIVPPAPEKSIIGATKVKMGSVDGQTPGQDSLQSKATFISLRRSGLERFINRVGMHPVLRLDSDFADFLESGSDLPRASSTSALSSASVLKMVSRMGETVNKITYKMEESDPWFQEKTSHIEQIEKQLRKLQGIVESVVACRRELAVSTGNLSVSLLNLASSEESIQLTRSIEGLARVQEGVEQTLEEQADADCANLLELVRDYLALVCTVKDVLGERVKAFYAWQTAVNNLHKKRELRTRMELGGRIERLGPLLEDVTECEARVEESQDNFNKISQVIKVEIDLFQHYRVFDLKALVLRYLEELTRTQLAILNHWEQSLPYLTRDSATSA